MMISKILLGAVVTGLVAGASAQARAADDGQSAVQLDGSNGAKHACKGQNACKGQGGCKTDKHACKGQNACKGQGGCRTDGKM